MKKPLFTLAMLAALMFCCCEGAFDPGNIPEEPLIRAGGIIDRIMVSPAVKSPNSTPVYCDIEIKDLKLTLTFDKAYSFSLSLMGSGALSTIEIDENVIISENYTDTDRCTIDISTLPDARYGIYINNMPIHYGFSKWKDINGEIIIFKLVEDWEPSYQALTNKERIPISSQYFDELTNDTYFQEYKLYDCQDSIGQVYFWFRQYFRPTTDMAIGYTDLGQSTLFKIRNGYCIVYNKKLSEFDAWKYDAVEYRIWLEPTKFQWSYDEEDGTLFVPFLSYNNNNPKSTLMNLTKDYMIVRYDDRNYYWHWGATYSLRVLRSIRDEEDILSEYYRTDMDDEDVMTAEEKVAYLEVFNKLKNH